MEISLEARRTEKPLGAPPSRYDNPFATCWTRPGALTYEFPAGHSAEQLVARLAAQQWRGAIVGPHGSGKSTLLEALKPGLLDVRRNMVFVTLRDGQRRLPQLRIEYGRDPSLLVIDGYEQLAWLEKARLKLQCRRASIGLLVTAHEPTNLPTLIRLAPDRALVERLVTQLAAKVSTPVNVSDVAASYACHGCNVREVFFALYDQHELLRRAARMRDLEQTQRSP